MEALDGGGFMGQNSFDFVKIREKRNDKRIEKKIKYENCLFPHTNLMLM